MWNLFKQKKLRKLIVPAEYINKILELWDKYRIPVRKSKYDEYVLNCAIDNIFPEFSESETNWRLQLDKTTLFLVEDEWAGSL